jgi:hypothetical protein
MNALTTYAKYLKKKLGYDAILKDLHEQALRELRKYENGRYVVSGVEFHVTAKVEKKYSDKVEEQMKELRGRISEIKAKEEEAGRVVMSEKITFDASIPKSVREEVLAEVPDYKKHFAL